ncbi:MAG: hypothetical protein NUV73_04120 [Candidatus Daviesbacteria bacterium]|nr:hypothetical protein [Candidatus Daviesbacteria bacterium]
MDDNINKIYTPDVIDDTPFPQEGESDIASSQNTGQTYEPETIKDQSFPIKRTAVELLSSALNTRSKKILQEFQFTPSGAIQVGNYQDGISGDIRISPDGIVARDSSGNTTFILDGATGDAVFAGSIQSGSVITGQVIVGNNNVIIDGVNRRIIVNDGTYDRVLIGYQLGGF